MICKFYFSRYQIALKNILGKSYLLVILLGGCNLPYCIDSDTSLFVLYSMKDYFKNLHLYTFRTCTKRYGLQQVLGH